MDRTLRGLLAGIIGAVPMNILNLILYNLELTNLRFIDWASIIMTGDLPKGLHHIIYSLIIQLFWSGALGIGLALLIPAITSQGSFIKAITYSFFMGFSFRGIVVLFQVPELYKVSTQTSELNFLSVIIWALTSAYILQKFNGKPLKD